MFLRNQTCRICGKEYQDCRQPCGDCLEKQEKRVREEWLKNFRIGLSLEDRVCKIEEMLYESQSHRHSSIHDAIF